MTAAIDDYATFLPGLTAPPKNMALVAYDDSNDLTHVARELLVFSAGDVKVTTLGGQSLVIPSVPAGFVLVGFFTRVWLTGTTVTVGKIVAAW